MTLSNKLENVYFYCCKYWNGCKGDLLWDTSCEFDVKVNKLNGSYCMFDLCIIYALFASDFCSEIDCANAGIL